MMLCAWKASQFPKNVQRHATVTPRWVRLRMQLVNAPLVGEATRSSALQKTKLRTVLIQTVHVKLQSGRWQRCQLDVNPQWVVSIHCHPRTQRVAAQHCKSPCRLPLWLAFLVSFCCRKNKRKRNKLIQINYIIIRKTKETHETSECSRLTWRRRPRHNIKS
jgi:hypothetical protein